MRNKNPVFHKSESFNNNRIASRVRVQITKRKTWRKRVVFNRKHARALSTLEDRELELYRYNNIVSSLKYTSTSHFLVIWTETFRGRDVKRVETNRFNVWDKIKYMGVNQKVVPKIYCVRRTIIIIINNNAVVKYSNNYTEQQESKIQWTCWFSKSTSCRLIFRENTVKPSFFLFLYIICMYIFVVFYPHDSARRRVIVTASL